MSPIKVQITSDVVCPWCAIGYYQLQKASQQTNVDIEVTWSPFELNPNMVPEGENLREHLAAKYGTTLQGSIDARARLTQMGAELGFTFNYADDMRMWNSFKAHQLIDWAASQSDEAAHQMKLALFEAYFNHRENISDPETLSDVAERAGLSKADALDVLGKGTHQESVRQKEHQAYKNGVSGVPFMVFVDRFSFSGAQGVENYASVLTQLRRLQTV